MGFKGHRDDYCPAGDTCLPLALQGVSVANSSNHQWLRKQNGTLLWKQPLQTQNRKINGAHIASGAVTPLEF